MMAIRVRVLIAMGAALMLAMLLLGPGCYPNPQPPGLSPVPTLPAGMTPTPAPRVQTPLGETPTLFVPQSLGQQAPFSPQIMTVVPPATVVAPAPVAVAADRVSAAAGAALYIEGCLCHGNQGQGVDAPALRNSQFVQVAGDQAVYTVIAFGRINTRMPAWLLGQCGPMTAEQIQSVVGYLRALQNVPPLATATPVQEGGTPQPGGAEQAPAVLETPSPSGPGEAVNLTGSVDQGRVGFGPYCASCHGPEGLQGIANPGSDDGVVPVLNPIDPSLASPDTKVFAANLAMPIQHGSAPSGPSPEIVMPAFGDHNLLTQQQIADLIAYIIFVNRNCPGRSCG